MKHSKFLSLRLLAALAVPVAAAAEGVAAPPAAGHPGFGGSAAAAYGTRVNDVEYPGAGVLALADRVYLTSVKRPGRVLEFEVTDPAAPRRLGAYDTGFYPQDLALAADGRSLYVVDGRAVTRLSVPGLKRLERTVISEDPLGGPVAVAVSGADVFLACRASGVYRNNQPFAAGFYARSVRVFDGRLYVATPNDLRCLDAATGRVLQILPVPNGTPVRIVRRPDSKALLTATGMSGFGRFSLPESAAPAPRGGLAALPLLRSAEGGCWTVSLGRLAAYGTFVSDLLPAADGRTLLLAAGESGVIVITEAAAADAASGRLAQPELAGDVPELRWTAVKAITASADGRTAYLADESFGLRVLDIRRPDRPRLIGSAAAE